MGSGNGSITGDKGNEIIVHKDSLVGKGSFGQVFDAEYKYESLKHIPLVCKEIDIQKIIDETGYSFEDVEMRIQREIEFMKMLVGETHFVHFVDSKRVEE